MSLSTFGRYHAYQTAVELERKGILNRLYVADLKRPPSEIRHKSRRFVSLAVQGRISQAAGAKALLERTWARFDARVASCLRVDNSRADIFHGFSLYSLEAFRTARSLGVKTVVERAGAHISEQKRLVEEEINRFGGGLPRWLQAYFECADRMVAEYEEADRILTCSETTRRSFLERGHDRRKVAAIHLGANFPARPVDRSAQKQFTVLCIGGDFYRKGIIYLVEAWRKLGLRDAQLMVSTVPPKRFLGLFDNKSVILLPRMPQAALAEYYARSSVFCLPSVEDAFPMVVLEAMSFGLPVVVSDATGTAEIVREATDGFVFPSRDSEALAVRILSLYENREMRLDFGRNSIERAREYTWSRYGDGLAGFYKEMLC